MGQNRANVKLIVESCLDVRELCHQLTNVLMAKQTATPKTIVFCRSLQHCANIFEFVKRILGKSVTEPPGITGELQTRIVDVFTLLSVHYYNEGDAVKRIL